MDTRERSVSRWLRLAMGAAVLVGVGRLATAEEDDKNPHVWQPKTKSVAVFKNGLGFFMQEGEVSLRDGWCVAKQVPPAAFGTLAIYAQSESETVDVVGAGPGEIVEFDGRDAPDSAASKRARLAASTNLNVQLTYKQKGQDRTSAGRLVSVGPEYAVLESADHSFAVSVEGIRKMQILDLPLRLHVQSAAGKPADKTTLGMAYLRGGITWVPDYTLKVLDEKTAELTLRGTLVNEAEDLVHTDVHLVVGVPHFTHTEFVAPIAVGQIIRTIGAAVATQGVPGAVLSQQMMNRAAIVSNANVAPQLEPGAPASVPVPVEGGDLARALGNLPQLGGAAATDYTVYTKKDLTLRRGEKAIVTLFVKRISYGHVYRWSPPERMEHSLVLENATDTPWTTGPCLALSAERPLSEDLLKYTPKGGHGELPVTAAINIAHDKSEREVERKLKAYSPDNNSSFFDLVTLEGRLELKNFERRDVRVVVSNPVPGKALSASDEGSMSTDSTKLKLLEREGSVRWELTLKPDQKKTLTYQYERYVPSR